MTQGPVEEAVPPVDLPPAPKKDGPIQVRGYQLEMLQQSLEKNVVVAMDTGSGKTHIAVMRIQAELEKGSDQPKRVWFLCPTVALAEQQHKVVSNQLTPFVSRIFTGNDGLDRWSHQGLWDTALHNVDVVVCTFAVLFDALTHAFVQISQISLIVFDEAHHCVGKSPANKIMQKFYHPCRIQGTSSFPSIMGLTASPDMRGTNAGLAEVESNLDAISKTPRICRDELLQHVFLPEILVKIYENDSSSCPILAELLFVVGDMDIHDDPYILSLCETNWRKYQKTLITRKTYCQEQITRLARVVQDLSEEYGSWFAEMYIACCVRALKKELQQGSLDFLGGLVKDEKRYLFKQLLRVRVRSIEEIELRALEDNFSDKVRILLDVLATECASQTTCILFVKTRVGVYLLARFLSTHPRTKDILRLGTFVGTSNHHQRTSNIDDLISTADQAACIEDLKSGRKNMIIATSVCEEGIDIAACNLVVCSERPANPKSFIQRRGRARKQSSKFILMFSNAEKPLLQSWIHSEKDMVQRYMDERRKLQALLQTEAEVEGYEELLIATTNAKLTPDEAVSHLYHFCNKLPQIAYTTMAPIFTFQASSDLEETASSFEQDMYSCTVLLPVTVDSSARSFSSSRYWASEHTARKDACFQACIGLHEAKLLNDNLLPFPTVDEEAEKAYSEVDRRAGQVRVARPWNSWALMKEVSRQEQNFQVCRLQFHSPKQAKLPGIRCILPGNVRPPSKMTLYVDHNNVLDICFQFDHTLTQAAYDDAIENACATTQLLLASVYPNKMKNAADDYMVLFGPDASLDEWGSWLTEMSKVVDANTAISTCKTIEECGLIRHAKLPGAGFLLRNFTPTLATCKLYKSAEDTQCLEALRLPKKRNFVTATASKDPVGPAAEAEILYLDVENALADRLPSLFANFSRLIPSITFILEINFLVDHLCDSLFPSVQFSDRSLVRMALSTPSANNILNYECLEFLGDSILKLMTSLMLMRKHLTWHEGYLTHAKDHLVSNGNLSNIAQNIGVDRYIRMNSFTFKRWHMPRWSGPEKKESVDDNQNVDENQEESYKSSYAEQRSMSSKVLADVIEAILGAAYLDGGFAKVVSCLKIFMPDQPWAEPIEIVPHIGERNHDGAPAPVNRRFDAFEKLVGHKFKTRLYATEALTHPAHMPSSRTGVSSYQRLEFLGDAVLDYLITIQIFQSNEEKCPLASVADPAYSALASSIWQPKEMHVMRTTAANAGILAFRGFEMSVESLTYSVDSTTVSKFNRDAPAIRSSPLKLSIPDFLRMAPNTALTSALQASRERFLEYQKDIDEALDSSDKYPWTLFAAFAPEKVLSDIIESIIGAIFVDTNASFDACSAFLKKLGIVSWISTALKGTMDLMHPKVVLGIMADDAKVKYSLSVAASMNTSDSTDDDAQMTQSIDELDAEVIQTLENLTSKEPFQCAIFIGEDEEHVASACGRNRMHATLRAAEEAIRIMRKTRAESSARTQ